MRDVESDPDADATYECFECGNVVVDDSPPGECEECGGDLRNRGMPIE
ncbi:MAG: rubrerythrin-like domain-containing protein [Haloarculaceae archaeon]